MKIIILYFIIIVLTSYNSLMNFNMYSYNKTKYLRKYSVFKNLLIKYKTKDFDDYKYKLNCEDIILCTKSIEKLIDNNVTILGSYYNFIDKITIIDKFKKKYNIQDSNQIEYYRDKFFEFLNNQPKEIIKLYVNHFHLFIDMNVITSNYHDTYINMLLINNNYLSIDKISSLFLFQIINEIYYIIEKNTNEIIKTSTLHASYNIYTHSKLRHLNISDKKYVLLSPNPIIAYSNRKKLNNKIEEDLVKLNIEINNTNNSCLGYKDNSSLMNQSKFLIKPYTLFNIEFYNVEDNVIDIKLKCIKYKYNYYLFNKDVEIIYSIYDNKK